MARCLEYSRRALHPFLGPLRGSLYAGPARLSRPFSQPRFLPETASGLRAPSGAKKRRTTFKSILLFKDAPAPPPSPATRRRRFAKTDLWWLFRMTSPVIGAGWRALPRQARVYLFLHYPRPLISRLYEPLGGTHNSKAATPSHGGRPCQGQGSRVQGASSTLDPRFSTLARPPTLTAAPEGPPERPRAGRRPNLQDPPQVQVPARRAVLAGHLKDPQPGIEYGAQGRLVPVPPPELPRHTPLPGLGGEAPEDQALFFFGEKVHGSGPRVRDLNGDVSIAAGLGAP